MSVHFRHNGADEFYPQAQLSNFFLNINGNKTENYDKIMTVIAHIHCDHVQCDDVQLSGELRAFRRNFCFLYFEVTSVKKGEIRASESLPAFSRITEVRASADHILAIYGGDMHKPRNYTHILIKGFGNIFYSNY